MTRFSFSLLTLLFVIACLLNQNLDNVSNYNDVSNQKLIKAGWFQDAVNWVNDLFDGDGNVNGTPGDPYNITLGKNGTHGGSWARDDHPYTIFNRHNGEVC